MDREGNVLYLEGLEPLDGIPLLDVKPPSPVAAASAKRENGRLDGADRSHIGSPHSARRVRCRPREEHPALRVLRESRLALVICLPPFDAVGI